MIKSSSFDVPQGIRIELQIKLFGLFAPVNVQGKKNYQKILIENKTCTFNNSNASFSETEYDADSIISETKVVKHCMCSYIKPQTTD